MLLLHHDLLWHHLLLLHHGLLLLHVGSKLLMLVVLVVVASPVALLVSILWSLELAFRSAVVVAGVPLFVGVKPQRIPFRLH